MRILVTGASGFIGRRLVPSLIHANHQVSLLLLPDVNQEGVALPIEFSPFQRDLDLIYADLRNYGMTARAVREASPDRVVHLAAVGVTDPFLNVHIALRHNLYGTLNLLRACYQNQSSTREPDQIIIARTPGELNPMNIYSASKAAAWDFCQMYARSYNWPVTGAKIFQAYGPNQPGHTLVSAAARAALANEDLAMSSGNQKRDWIWIDDVAEGLLAAVASDLPPGSTVELGTGQLTSVVEVARLIYRLAESTGKPLIGTLPDRPGEIGHEPADVVKVERLTGWLPTTSLEDGLTKFLSTFSK